jgi:hypothetical protein
MPYIDTGYLQRERKILALDNVFLRGDGTGK